MDVMPRYEVRYSKDEEWIEITEIELMDGLYKQYDRLTPLIKKMLAGKELHTSQAVYRLKWQFGNPRINRHESKTPGQLKNSA
jgi:hypothetical protein